MKERNPEKWRDRKFRLLLYPDDPTHAEAMNRLKFDGYTYAEILHDKDVWAEDDDDVTPELIGTLKKPHWHVVVKFPNPVYNQPLANKLGIKPNYIRVCDNLDKALLYLTHETYPSKFQYDLEEVHGDLKTRLAALLADDDEGTRALRILDIIRNSPGTVTFTEVFEKAIKAGLYGDFRRMGNGVSWLIRDHNEALDQQFNIMLDEQTREEKTAAFRERVKQFSFEEWIARMERSGSVLIVPTGKLEE